MQTLRIATRQSPLALWQAEHVRGRLLALHPDLRVELLPMSTEGDRRLAVALYEIGGKGLFLKELEQALIEHRADLAVHSLKDVPVIETPGLEIAAVLRRESPFDALVSGQGGQIGDLPKGARVGTASLRREVFLRALRPDLAISQVRGNVGTRLRKLDDGHFDALVLAEAGLMRLGLAERVRHRLAPPEFIPAVGQGVLAIQTRGNDVQTKSYVGALNDLTTMLEVRAERALSAALGGACHVPVAGYARLQRGALSMQAAVGDPATGAMIQASDEGSAMAPEALGAQLAQALLDRGAGPWLARG